MLYVPIIRYGFHCRENFGQFLNDKKLTQYAVEVGLHRGEFSRQLLQGWKGKCLYGVDPYPLHYDPYDPICQQKNRDHDIQLMQENLRQYIEVKRFELLKMRSDEAVQKFHDNSLDFVYVDAKHRREDVKEDLKRWWPKIRSGGVLAGHDFICPSMERNKDVNWADEIQPVVWEFAELHNRDIWLVTEQPPFEPHWSFYLLKE